MKHTVVTGGIIDLLKKLAIKGSDNLANQVCLDVRRTRCADHSTATDVPGTTAIAHSTVPREYCRVQLGCSGLQT